MDAYAVFEGGGVKGAAFAGALKAAEEHGVNFIGYGGASAGSIVAFLATLGFSGDEILIIMKSFSFNKLLDEPIHDEIESTKKNLKEIFEKIKHKSNLCKLYVIIKNKKKIIPAYNIIRRIIKDNGAYSTRNIISLLSYQAFIKYPNDIKYCNKRNEFYLSFLELYKLTGKDLKVISTDLISGSAQIFSHLTTPEDCVFQAIAASSSYPFVFKPKEDNGKYYVDGGLSCNLPTYLFHDEYYKNLPILAFDLYTPEIESEKSFQKLGFLKFINRFLFSTLDASNDIINNVVGGICIPVKVPTNIDTLSFNVSSDDITIIFDSGYNSAYDYLNNHLFKKLLSTANSKSKKAKFLYGHCHQPVLEILATKLHIINTDAVKIWLYTCIDINESELFSFEMYTTGHSIKEHSFPLNNNHFDCVQAWNTKEDKFSYDSKKNITRVCLPIIRNSVQYHLDQNLDDLYHRGTILGVICIAKNCDIPNTGWFKESTSNLSGYELDSDFVEITQPYIDIIEKIMLGAQASFNFRSCNK
ncbi:patatin-like phospholipase family protein [Photobacterium phosphoreum]|uniref:patatin-like phospholipase family protein n=1 Tax=Photobacterium phosphoreum TaxID=659 RepID=UPI002431FD8B|nr:patatin-like phospholipase family protein [Photobacterium phosphoreum]